MVTAGERPGAGYFYLVPTAVHWEGILDMTYKKNQKYASPSNGLNNFTPKS